MDRKLPCYQLMIDDSFESDLQVDCIGLVDLPAIEKNFIAFKKVEEKEIKELNFTTVNEDRRIISGPAMLAEVPLYRRDEQLGEYTVEFSAPTIYSIVQKFFSKGFNQNFNIMHSPEAKVDGVNVFESFIVDSTRGIQPMRGFEDAKDGSWFMSAKVNNDEVWNKIKAGEVKGFSVEGLFQYKKSAPTPQQIFEQIKKLLENIQL